MKDNKFIYDGCFCYRDNSSMLWCVGVAVFQPCYLFRSVKWIEDVDSIDEHTRYTSQIPVWMKTIDKVMGSLKLDDLDFDADSDVITHIFNCTPLEFNYSFSDGFIQGTTDLPLLLQQLVNRHVAYREQWRSQKEQREQKRRRSVCKACGQKRLHRASCQ
jgi:hypothetical protein